MLRNVHLKNLALIKEADIDFKHGLNILTGETGTGKSIIIGSINIALGDKANKSIIRKNCDYALVELLFTDVNKDIVNALPEYGIETDGNNINISRKINHDSGITRINGQNVTLNTLKAIASKLINVHGQHDSISLLNSYSHIDILDDFGGELLSDVKSELKNEHAFYRKLRYEYKKFTASPEELKREQALCEFELDEIEKAAIKPMEDINLEAEYKKLSNARDINKALNNVHMMLSGSDRSVTDIIASSVKELNSAIKCDESLKTFHEQMMDIESLSKDLSSEISSFIDRNMFDEQRLTEVKERLDLINHLKTRYGNTIEEISAYKDNLISKLSDFSGFHEKKKDFENKINISGKRLNELSVQLSDLRKETASGLELQIIDNLKDLNFLNCNFYIKFDKLEKITENGFDKVEFMFSANPGEDAKPLSKVASGGEVSRIMLALKSVTAKNETIGTLIFDEIDTGISGLTAQKVAEKMYNLSKNHQIISITHLPQIAAMADTHFMIHKEVNEGGTISGIEELDYDRCIIELSKLVGGAEITHAAIDNAKELIEKAALFKAGSLSK